MLRIVSKMSVNYWQIVTPRQLPEVLTSTVMDGRIDLMFNRADRYPLEDNRRVLTEVTTAKLFDCVLGTQRMLSILIQMARAILLTIFAWTRQGIHGDCLGNRFLLASGIGRK